MAKKPTWLLEDHLCRICGGRILRCATNQGATPGGNPVFKCADCGKSTSSPGPESLCWCGFSHRLNPSFYPYVCRPFSILESKPELRAAFLACGCIPERGEVGIMLVEAWKKDIGETSESA